MAGIADTYVLDLVTHDPDSDEYALIMIETREWGHSPDQLAQLQEKINNYTAFALDGLADRYPDSVGRPLRFQLDCVSPPIGEYADLVAHAARLFADHEIRFVVNVLDR